MKLEEEIKQKKFRDEYQKLMLNIVFTGNWFNSQLIKTFKPYGLSPQQYNVLRILNGQHPGAITVNQIAERMLDKNSNASRLIDKLVLKELVDRRTCEKDRRQMDVIITPKGITMLDTIAKDINQLEKDVADNISKDQAKLVNQILDELRG
ncbi:MAG: MarR family transcriptional regulator [Flavobacteriales bacterium]|nr:MarR family transcriptional regulator [Flavobacteriales bacterium]